MHVLRASGESPADGEKVANLWREFSNNLFALLNGADSKDQEKVEIALGLANALLQIEPNEEAEGAVQKGIEALKKRYGFLGN